MKVLKMYLMVMGALLTFAILAGVAVWYLYQDLPGANPRVFNQGDFSQKEGSVSQKNDADTLPAIDSTVPPDRTYTIDIQSLTDTQRAALKAFGKGDEDIVVTESMVACAKKVLGEERLSSILEGGAPTPYESIALLPCFSR